MILNRQEVIHVITALINANPNLLEKVYLQLEKKPIIKSKHYQVLENYKTKVVEDINKFNFEKYLPFFPVLSLFAKNQTEAEYNSELSIDLNEHVVFSSLVYADQKPYIKKFANKILWDLSAELNQLAQHKYEDYSLFYNQLKKDKSLLDLIHSLGGTSLVESSSHDNTIQDERFQVIFPTEYNSITQSDDLRNLFYLELVNLKDKDLDVIFFKKFVDKSLMTYVLGQYSNVDIFQKFLPSDLNRNSGSVIVAIDTSASMLGVQEIIAKYLAYLILEICLPAKRNVVLVSYSVNYFFYQINPNSSLSEIKVQLEKFLNQSFYGGTDVNQAFEKVFDLMRNNEDLYYADIVLISDFLFKDCSVQLAKNKLYQNFCNRKNRIIGLEVNTMNTYKKKLPKFIDEHYIYFFSWIKTWTHDDWIKYFQSNFSAKTKPIEIEPKFNYPYYGFLRKVYSKTKDSLAA